MNLPEGFLEQFAPYGIEALDQLGESLDGDSTASVRLNPAKGGMRPEGSERVEWCDEGFYLSERPAFTLDPALHQGRYYVQDSSSMFISHILRQLTSDGNPRTYLDACAAPGGKATAALSALPEGSLVVANEFVGQRAAILRENLTKWGWPNVVVTRGDTRRFADDGCQFDIIAADVPCSGEGMMRKDEQAVRQWSAKLVDQCASLQREIVDNLWAALRPGGILIYSTCTFNRKENEEMVEYLIERYGAEPVEIAIEPQWGIIGAIDAIFPAYRFIPGSVRGEGQFMAVVRKPDDSSEADENNRRRKQKKEKRSNAKKAAAIPDTVIRRLASWPDGTEFSADSDGRITATLPTGFESRVPYRPTIEAGAMKGKEFIPSHELAMSTLLNKETVNCVELDRTQALDYLRCQALTLPTDTPRGIVLATYGGYPLGWAKNIGNRANNLYPKPWRILSERR